ncbi:MAG: penicillin-binding protein 1C, partial [Acetobacteraceae bacterium]|nr:penicillin-binding protein 1C [Acetobacteraceae bacterium]
AGGVSPAEREAALLAEVPRARRPMPNLAPHLAREVREGPTTLDAAVQRAAERLAAEARRGLPDRASVAILVADIATREVRALVGGAWMEEGRAGALDLTRAVRSPGSALKPVIHVVAYAQGVARPDALLDDLPARFGSYAPENFDRGFQGRITVADSLRLSLNQPAVALLSEVGPNRLAATLREAGVVPRLPQGAEPTLPLALGGVGVTLREMVALYATLADAGRAAPLRLTPAAMTEPRSVLDARAARQVAGVLVNRFPEGGPAGIAWKTGTSWGGRDAWALGFDARHVVGVWVGRPDGTPIPGLTGGRFALPLLARAFAQLPEAPLSPLPVRPAPGLAPDNPDRLRLLFPPPGAVLAEGGRVVIRAMGGQRPLRFLVDGAPIASDPARRETPWEPPGPGFYRVTVVDAAGGAVRAELRVR